MGSHTKGSHCWCGVTHPLTYRCLADVPNCNCDGTALTIGGALPEACSHVHGLDGVA